MKNNNGNNTKLILLYPYIQKQGSSNRLWLLDFISFFTVAFLCTFIYTRESITIPISTSAAATTTITTSSVPASTNAPLPKSFTDALVHYPSKFNTSGHMSHGELKKISDVLRQCSTPCNFLVFGLTLETLLWKALNHNAHTVFIDEILERYM